MLRRTQVLYRVHGHAREGLGVGVAVVQAVDEAVDGADVHEAVRDVEVEVAPERHHHHPEDIPRQQVAAAEDLRIRGVGYDARGPQPHEHALPRGPLEVWGLGLGSGLGLGLPGLVLVDPGVRAVRVT